MPLTAPFSSVIEYVAAFFQEHPRLRLKVVASTSTAVESRHEIIEDQGDSVRRHDALELSLQPWSRFFPAFKGSLTVRPHRNGSLLAIDGSYTVPGGKLGALFHRVIGERLAFSTMDHLLDQLRRDVEQRYQAFVAASPTIEELNARQR